MIHEIITHSGLDFDFTVIDELARIDLTKDVIICYNPETKDKIEPEKKLIKYNIDEFTLYSHEQYKSIAVNSILTFRTFPRLKLILPNGLFPEFKSLLPGINVRNVTYNKIEGVELNQSLQIDDLHIDITAIKGTYSYYDLFDITYGVYDQQLFGQNKFTGNAIPNYTKVCNLRLIPHFIGNNIKLNNIYIICSKYIHSRLPNF